MRFEFGDRRLLALNTSEAGVEKYGVRVAEAFFEVMAVIAGARDTRDIRALKCLHCEKLKGQRAHQHSLRLCGGSRLIVQERRHVPGPYLLIEAIEDYH